LPLSGSAAITYQTAAGLLAGGGLISTSSHWACYYVPVPGRQPGPGSWADSGRGAWLALDGDQPPSGLIERGAGCGPDGRGQARVSQIETGKASHERRAGSVRRGSRRAAESGGWLRRRTPARRL